MRSDLHSERTFDELSRTFRDQLKMSRVFEDLLLDEVHPEYCYGLLSARAGMNRTLRDIKRAMGLPVHDTYKVLPWLQQANEKEDKP